MPSIEITNLVASYEGHRVLDDVSLRIEDGELFFLIGPSGCGKTTLLRLIAGFLKPVSGQIRFDGVDMTSTPPHRRETAMMFQSYALWPHMTVAENVAFGLEERGLSKKAIAEKVLEALTAVCLDAYRDRRIGELSGGQQQRVALARALVVRPRCLLLDEPLSNLDARLRQGMRDEIRRITKAHHLTAIYVTHDQEEALSMADRIAVMSHGKVLQLGPPKEVYRRPSVREVAEFMGDTNLLDIEIVGPGEGEGSLRVLWAGQEMTISSVAEPFTTSKPSGALLSIRPEAFRLERPETPAVSFAVIVESASYHGATIAYRVRTLGDHLLRILLLDSSAPLHPPGDSLELWVALDDMALLRD
jgi:iron(III) transport system ATP-binding protein